LQELPEDAIPIELISTTKYSSNVEILNTEHNRYVPDQHVEENEKEELDGYFFFFFFLVFLGVNRDHFFF
jgi:hypothetical protein